MDCRTDDAKVADYTRAGFVLAVLISFYSRCAFSYVLLRVNLGETPILSLETTDARLALLQTWFSSSTLIKRILVSKLIVLTVRICCTPEIRVSLHDKSHECKHPPIFLEIMRPVPRNIAREKAGKK